MVPLFKGWKLQVRSAKLTSPVKKTVETYLPPINAKVTDYITIQKYMHFLRNLSADVNMPHVNITLDVGAAMNAFLVIWNAPEFYSNVIIHLGSFHFIKENFQVCHILNIILSLHFFQCVKNCSQLSLKTNKITNSLI